jgi:hypothetical protein
MRKVLKDGIFGVKVWTFILGFIMTVIVLSNKAELSIKVCYRSLCDYFIQQKIYD